MMIEEKSSQKFSKFHFVWNAEKQTAPSQRTGKQIKFECPQAQKLEPSLTHYIGEQDSVKAQKNPQTLKWRKNHLNQTLTQHNVLKCFKYPFHKNNFF